ncbi:MAG: hypothetical protein J5J06_07525 [Phycisphaerae bacterium]|nr:hypothetical protein [Phycisphaerae bacterium]
MMSAIYRYEFNEQAAIADVECTLHLALIGAKGLFGESTVRMDAAYSIDQARRIIAIDARSEVGHAICQLFTGYLTKEFGEAAFTVRAVDHPPITRSSEAEAVGQ